MVKVVLTRQARKANSPYASAYSVGSTGWTVAKRTHSYGPVSRGSSWEAIAPDGTVFGANAATRASVVALVVRAVTQGA